MILKVLGLGLLTLAVLVAACGGSGGRGSETAVRRDVERAGDIVFGSTGGFGDSGGLGSQPGLIEYEQYIARECRSDDDLATLILGRGFLEVLIGDAKARLEVTEVEFLSDDRALVSTQLTLDGEVTDLFGEATEDEEPVLWVYQDGRWRSADDCAFYGTADEDGEDFFEFGTEDSAEQSPPRFRSRIQPSSRPPRFRSRLSPTGSLSGMISSGASPGGSPHGTTGTSPWS